jgi:hypothetical protein
MADLLRGVFAWHDAQRLLLAAGYTIRLGRGDHRVIRCRCGKASAVLPASPKREITRGLQGRVSRQLACECMG